MISATFNGVSLAALHLPFQVIHQSCKAMDRVGIRTALQQAASQPLGHLSRKVPTALALGAMLDRASPILLSEPAHTIIVLSDIVMRITSSGQD